MPKGKQAASRRVTIAPGGFVDEPREVLVSTLERAAALSELLFMYFADEETRSSRLGDEGLSRVVATIEDHLEVARKAAQIVGFEEAPPIRTVA